MRLDDCRDWPSYNRISEDIKVTQGEIIRKKDNIINECTPYLNIARNKQNENVSPLIDIPKIDKWSCSFDEVNKREKAIANNFRRIAERLNNISRVRIVKNQQKNINDEIIDIGKVSQKLWRDLEKEHDRLKDKFKEQKQKVIENG